MHTTPTKKKQQQQITRNLFSFSFVPNPKTWFSLQNCLPSYMHGSSYFQNPKCQSKSPSLEASTFINLQAHTLNQEK
jgi:hypothetical protein